MEFRGIRNLVGYRRGFSLSVISAVVVLSLVGGAHSLSDHYDFIVVGGGTGGCAMAGRLAESGRHSVLLIESGDVPPADLEIPAYAPRFVPNRNVTFVFPSFPQEFAAKRRSGIINSISARMLGGTSSLNYMWFNRGSPRDYDYWAKVTKDPSWKYANMMKYFKKVETYNGDYPSDQHGYQGPITITRPKYAPGLDIWLEAGKSLGYPIADPNGPQKISFGPVEFSKRFGRRVSSFTGYVQPLLPYRPNLHILLNTNVTEVIFSGKRAIGVKFHSKNPNLKISDDQVFASKEIVLSAGTFNSPLILLRSGVGPRKNLQECGIRVVQDLPVGNGFHDHVSLPIHLFVNDSSAIVDEANALNAENLEYFNLVGDGPYSNTRGGTGQSFVASSVAKSEGEGDWADLHICMAHSNEPYLSAYIDGDENGASENEEPMSGAVFIVRPKSRGSLKLNPKDPLGLPDLNVGYFSDPRDVRIALDGIKEALRIFEDTPAYNRIGTRVVTIDYEECEKLEYRSEEFWKCYIRHATQAGLHSGGTCRMGWGAGDHKAVVDSNLKVIGVKGLRVVDASVMPAQTNANTEGAVYAIAEKASDMILGDWETRRWGHGGIGRDDGRTLSRLNNELVIG